MRNKKTDEEQKTITIDEVLIHLFDDERLERFRRRLPLYRQEEAFQGYDIVKVQYLLHLLQRQPVSIAVEPLAKQYNFYLGQELGFFKVNTTWAMKSRVRVNSRPIIAIVDQTYPVIDGLHRLYRAAHTGNVTLQCLYLTTSEVRFCTRPSIH